MILNCFNPRRIFRPGQYAIYVWVLLALLLRWLWLSSNRVTQDASQSTPLVNKYIYHGEGEGGRWYIPPSWLERVKNETGLGSLQQIHPRTVLEAATLSLELSLRNQNFIKHTNIPLIIHQTWKNYDSPSWPKLLQNSIEEWMETATNANESTDYPEMAYIMWDDAGSEDLIKTYEPKLWNGYSKLPKMVEKTDSFRVAVLKWFGGVYADVDTRPLQHPYNWVQDGDLRDRSDSNHSVTHHVQPAKQKTYIPPKSASVHYKGLMQKYAPSQGNVSAIFGIEADTPVGKDDYWRSGYMYYVQLSNWAFAMAPQHPTAARYVRELRQAIDQNITRLAEIDPLELTGPGPLVRAVRGHCEADSADFDWNALSGLHDPKGGRGKVAAGDVLVLPITGFSPGRGRFHNMGSEPINHPNARLFHAAAGSWRDATIKVQIGKLCRTFLGRCKDWSKVS